MTRPGGQRAGDRPDRAGRSAGRARGRPLRARPRRHARAPAPRRRRAARCSRRTGWSSLRTEFVEERRDLERYLDLAGCEGDDRERAAALAPRELRARSSAGTWRQAPGAAQRKLRRWTGHDAAHALSPTSRSGSAPTSSPGQIVTVGADHGQHELARAIADSAYKRGAPVRRRPVLRSVRQARPDRPCAARRRSDFVPSWFGQRMLAIGERAGGAHLARRPDGDRAARRPRPRAGRPRPAAVRQGDPAR